MPKAYSTDLRERVFNASEKDKPEQVAALFKVTARWIYALRKRKRETGSIEPIKGKQGRKAKIDGADREKLRELVAKHPDATLKELLEMLGIQISISTLSVTLNKMKLRYKKKYSRR